MALTADVSYLEYGKPFRVHGEVDTSMSKTEVKDYKVVLREIVTKTSSGGKIRNYTRDYLLFDAKNHISLGQNAIFEA